MVSGSHAYARRAHVSNRSFVFLLSQVSHIRKKREKTRRRILQNGSMEHWISMSFRSFMSAQSAYLLKLFLDECVNSSYLVCYKGKCDTCDSKNDKTPVMCACAYARRQVIIVILQFIFL